MLSLPEAQEIKQTPTANTFLMSAPKGQTATVDGWRNEYRVVATQDNAQIIEVVSASDDGGVTGRYRATAQSVEPLSSRMDYFGHAFSALPVGLATGFLVWFCGLALRRKHRIQRPEIQS
jgi:hypothetical protein